jgi:beta-N-acetylhexosaminidase
VRELTATGVPITAAAMRNPYDALGFPDVDGYVAAYGFRAVTVRALAAVLAGRSGAGGRLPVTVPGLFAFGSGLQR